MTYRRLALASRRGHSVSTHRVTADRIGLQRRQQFSRLTRR